MTSNNVIILAAGLNGLGAIRSTHLAGLNSIVVRFAANDLSAYSRLPLKQYCIEDKSKERLLQIISDIGKEHGPCSIIACSDFSAEVLSQLEPEELAPHVKLSPDAKTVELLNDKYSECKVMLEGGVAMPATYFNVAECSESDLPVIIKPRTYKGYNIIQAKNVIATTAEELAAFVSKYRSNLELFIAQEIITGSDDNLWVCNTTFDQQSNLVGCFVFKRLGTMPSHYGVTSVAISQFNAELEKECQKIGKALNYTGAAMIEFKYEQRRDRYYYIETNPRLGMCNWFDSYCGINNVASCHQIAFGMPTANKQAQKNDILYWNFSGDLIARLEDKEPFKDIVKRYFSYLRYRKLSPTFVFRDPLPALYYHYQNYKSIVMRLIKKLAASEKRDA